MYYVIDILTEALFAQMDVSKFRDGIVHFRNSGVKGLPSPLFFHKKEKY